MNIVEAINNSKLFKPLFRDLETWKTWTNVVLKAAYGLPLSRSELKVYQTITGRKKAPKRPVKTLVIVAGRRSGKSFIISVKAVYQGLFFNYRPFLSPGERGVIQIIAADRQQSRTIFNYCSGILHSNPAFEACIVNETKERIELNTQVDIEIQTASFRTIRGKTVVSALCDEIAYWMADGSSPDTEIINAIKPGMLTIPHACLDMLSSPYARRGVLWEYYQEYWANDEAEDTLVIKAPSLLLNPTLDEKHIEGEIAKGSAARAEWLAEWREDIEDFLSLEQIQAVVAHRGTLPAEPHLFYHAFTDPSGGRSDAFTLAIGHRQEDRHIVDLVRAWEPPFDPSVVVEGIAEVCKAYRVSQLTGDKYGGEWVTSAFQKVGLTYQTSPLTKSDLYLNLEPTINTRKIELPNDEKLITELRSLERRRGRSGRDVINHPPMKSARDDRANSVAGVAWLLARKTEAPLLVGWLDPLSMKIEGTTAATEHETTGGRQPRRVQQGGK
jgi:hypothetical protein